MKILETLLDLFLPRICHVCEDKLLDDEEFICRHCLEKLPRTGYENYWLNREKLNSDLNPFEQRFAGQLPMDRGCAPFFYNRDSSLASLIHDFKYRGFSKLAVTMGRLAATELLPSGLFEGVDYLIPVPLHRTKQLKRGYNQSEMIARGISQATGIPVSLNLKAIKPHRTQTALNAQQRIENTKNIFQLKEPEKFEGLTLMLVDDICTTGATLLSAGEAVAGAIGNVRLRLFTLGVV